MYMKINKGFTLIELLIVIGVLGILAAGLLAAVDPFEQLKKARDANNRNAVIELHNAFTRYYATHGSLPWDNSALAGVGCVETIFGVSRDTAAALDDTDLGACITSGLEADGELKTGFVAAVGDAQAAKTFVNSPASTQVIVCFSPEGKGLFADAATKYDQDGTDVSATTCSAAAKASLTPGSTCFWCAR